jgi:hypothetical protein
MTTTVVAMWPTTVATSAASSQLSRLVRDGWVKVSLRTVGFIKLAGGLLDLAGRIQNTNVNALLQTPERFLQCAKFAHAQRL